MKKAIIYLFIGLSLLVWLVEMFTGWFDQTLLRQFIRGAWGVDLCFSSFSLWE